MHEWTHADFDALSLHDNLLRGLSIRNGLNGTSDLVLDIDHIVAGDPIDGGWEWRVAAADLVFHGVTGLQLSMGWPDRNFQIAPVGDSITDLRRHPVSPQLVYFDRPYWKWEFSFAMDTKLSLGAWGFTLRLRQEPIRCAEQKLPLELRA